jgi:hypothetical protein
VRHRCECGTRVPRDPRAVNGVSGPTA